MALEGLAAVARNTHGPWLMITGAGVSLASGIPTFRGADPGAVWSADVTEMGTRRFFNRNPAESWRWYLGRFSKLEGKQPNPAHTALVDLERWQTARGGGFTLLTQNIDGLHAMAGSKNLIEVHGAARKVRCSREGCQWGSPKGTLPANSIDFRAFRQEPTLENVPCCPECGHYLRPHVLWFDEYYQEHEDYQILAAKRAMLTAQLVIFAGTSFSVGITAMAVEAATRYGIPAFNLDPSGEEPHPKVIVEQVKAEEAFPALAIALGAR